MRVMDQHYLYRMHGLAAPKRAKQGQGLQVQQPLEAAGQVAVTSPAAALLLPPLLLALVAALDPWRQRLHWRVGLHQLAGLGCTLRPTATWAAPPLPAAFTLGLGGALPGVQVGHALVYCSWLLSTKPDGQF
jgi:hypothetical protein